MGKNPRKWVLGEEDELEVVGWGDKLKQQRGYNILCVLSRPLPSLCCPLGLYPEELFHFSWQSHILSCLSVITEISQTQWKPCLRQGRREMTDIFCTVTSVFQGPMGMLWVSMLFLRTKDTVCPGPPGELPHSRQAKGQEAGAQSNFSGEFVAGVGIAPENSVAQG